MKIIFNVLVFLIIISNIACKYKNKKYYYLHTRNTNLTVVNRGPLTPEEELNLIPDIDGPFETIKSKDENFININPAIIGGNSASDGQFPWMVAIIQDNRWFCGGSIIHQRWILTAGHCAHRVKRFDIYMGVSDFSSPNGIWIRANRKYVHPRFNSRTFNNDIALIRLNDLLPTLFFELGYLSILRLPTLTMASDTFVGTNVTICGWGFISTSGLFSPVLQYVTIPIIRNTQCAQVYGTQVVTSSIICTYSEFSENVCSGDSGGPVQIQENDGNWTIIGIISFGSRMSCVGFPAGYTRVTSHLSWIYRYTRIPIRL